VDILRPNSLNRLKETVVDCGGKGINVSATIRALGGGSIALGFAGGHTGDELLSLISGKGIRHDFVRIKGATRTNFKVIAEDGTLTEFNEPGPEVTDKEWRTLEAKLAGYAKPDALFALSGSLCRGLEPDTYRKLCAFLKARGAYVLLDADGAALKSALDAETDQTPDCLKLNRSEFLDLFGLIDNEKVTEERLSDLLIETLGKGVKLCALSLGSRGALFADQRGVWRYSGLTVPVQSTVGAGDTMAGALAYGFEQKLNRDACFALSLAASAAACATKGTSPPDPDLVHKLLKQVVFQKIK
jgi:1-phosphofructokinase